MCSKKISSKINALRDKILEKKSFLFYFYDFLMHKLCLLSILNCELCPPNAIKYAT